MGRLTHQLDHRGGNGANPPADAEASEGVAAPAASAPAPQARAKTKGVADIVFLVDVSGSMAPCIDALRKNIEAFIDSLSQGDAEQRRSGEGLARQGRRISRHRGCPRRRPALDRRQPLRDAMRAHSRRNSLRLQAAGGGDEPESLLDALYKVASMEATPKGLAERGSRKVALSAAMRRASSSSSPTPRSRRR